MFPRYLIVTADDFGIGPATSEGILDLARDGVVTSAALLVNSPFAEVAVREWRRRGRPVELGWHPCLTLDAPLLPPRVVPSLVRTDGTFWSLSAFLRGLWLGTVLHEDLVAELAAQCGRFVELTGKPPASVNAHHHLHVLPRVAAALGEAFAGHRPSYERRVSEPWSMIRRVSGARCKRLALTLLSPSAPRLGLRSNDVLVGLTDAHNAADPQHLLRWLLQVPGRVVELMCHPGYRDETLMIRDGGLERVRQRVHELERLRDPRFLEACREAGFTLTSPGRLDRERALAA